MLLILVFTPMSRRRLAIVSTIVGAGLLMLGIRSAHSEGSLTWAVHHIILWLAGTAGAVAIWSLSFISQDRVVPPPPLSNPPEPNVQEISSLLLSLKTKILYLFSGAISGGIIGQSLIYGSVNDRSTFDYDTITLSDTPLLLILIVGFTTTPIIIILSQLIMTRTLAISCSIMVGLLVLSISVIYGQYESWYGHYRLAYYSLWVTGMLTAFTSVKLQKKFSSSSESS